MPFQTERAFPGNLQAAVLVRMTQPQHERILYRGHMLPSFVNTHAGVLLGTPGFLQTIALTTFRCWTSTSKLMST